MSNYYILPSGNDFCMDNAYVILVIYHFNHPGMLISVIVTYYLKPWVSAPFYFLADLDLVLGPFGDSDFFK